MIWRLFVCSQITFIGGRAFKKHSPLVTYTILLRIYETILSVIHFCGLHSLTASNLWNFTHSEHSHTRAHARTLSEKFRVKSDFCPGILNLFLCILLHSELAGQDWQMLCWRDSCQHSIWQLGQVLLTFMTSPCHEGCAPVPPGSVTYLCVTCAPWRPFERTLGTV